MDDLVGLACRFGVERSYVDARGEECIVEDEVIRQVVSALAASGCTPRPPLTELLSQARAFEGHDDKRKWLLAVQLYGIRSSRNWGHGDFRDLSDLLELTADIGAAGVGVNPLHALFPDQPEQASPYSPNSRLFLNPLYIDVEAAPGFPGMGRLAIGEEVRRLRRSHLVDYAGVASVKMRGLRASWARFHQAGNESEKADFAVFQQERGLSLRRFAAFETLRQRFGRSWWSWPDEWRHAHEHDLDALSQAEAGEIGFQEYVQWVADRQLRAASALARRRSRSIGLYTDLAVGVDRGGADAWAGQHHMLNGLSIGAPPDSLNTQGQDWGITTYNPHCLRELDFEPLHELFATAMRHAGAIRVDHILGLNRMFVIPSGTAARRGTYVRYPLDDMLEVLAEESTRRRCIVIGEDLGTVPDGFRQKLSDRGIWTYLVTLLERDEAGAFRPSERYPASALATFSTHDLPTFTGWVCGHDLRVKRAIALDPGETDEERRTARTAFESALASPDQGKQGFINVVRFLGRTASRLVMIAAEDVWEVADQTNVPGTIDQHPNWRRRLPVAVERIQTDERLRRVAEVLGEAGRAD